MFRENPVKCRQPVAPSLPRRQALHSARKLRAVRALSAESRGAIPRSVSARFGHPILGLHHLGIPLWEFIILASHVENLRPASVLLSLAPFPSPSEKKSPASGQRWDFFPPLRSSGGQLRDDLVLEAERPLAPWELTRLGARAAMRAVLAGNASALKGRALVRGGWGGAGRMKLDAGGKGQEKEKKAGGCK